MITIRHAMLADYAMVSREGKLSIIGIFERLYAPKCPVVHPQMALVLSFEADRAETGRPHRLEFQLIDADGNAHLSFGGEISIAPPRAGENARFNHIVNLNNVAFKHFGVYEFKMMINGEVRLGIPIRVLEAVKHEGGRPGDIASSPPWDEPAD